MKANTLFRLIVAMMVLNCGCKEKSAQDRKRQRPSPQTVLLCKAAEEGAVETVRDLISGGASINGRAEADQTPLHYAVRKGHKDVVELLVASGAGVNTKDRFGWTPRNE